MPLWCPLLWDNCGNAFRQKTPLIAPRIAHFTLGFYFTKLLFSEAYLIQIIFSAGLKLRRGAQY